MDGTHWRRKREDQGMGLSGVVDQAHMARDCKDTHDGVVVWRWAKPQCVCLCVCVRTKWWDVHAIQTTQPPLTHTARESSHKATCHPHHVCVCEAEEWAVDDHSGLVVCVMVMVGGEEGRGGGWWWEKHKKGGEWWMKGGMV